MDAFIPDSTDSIIPSPHLNGILINSKFEFDNLISHFCN